ncbi:heparin lyase I family protein [Thiocapsa sp.]|uniref:heparin lyase I family protein n=1 Tax=Thiocapsa sp. TaxID=2024551 RepID=UPI003593DF01
MTYLKASALHLIYSMMLLSSPSIADTITFGFEPNQNPPGFTGPLGGMTHQTLNINTLPSISTEKSLSGTSSLKSYVHIYESPVPYRSQALVNGYQTLIDINRGANTKSYWVGFAVWIPEWYPRRDPIGGMEDQIHEWHGSPGPDYEWGCAGGNPIEFYLIPDSPTEGRIKLMLQGGVDLTGCDPADPTTQPSRVYQLINNNVAPYLVGQWNFIVYNVKFDYTVGFFKLWVNGTQRINFTGATHSEGSGSPYPIWGFYGGWKDRITNDPEIVERTFYFDDVRITDDPSASYDSVAPQIAPVRELPRPTGLEVLQ